MTSQIPFTPLTPEAMERLTLDEVLAFEAATCAVAGDQKPSLEVIASLVLTVQRLITEPAELAGIRREQDSDRYRRALWILVRQFGGDVFLTDAQFTEVPALPGLVSISEADGLRILAAESAAEPAEAARPGPRELWEQAVGGTPGYDRDRYIALLREHGHLLSPGDDGYEEAPADLPYGWRPRPDQTH